MKVIRDHDHIDFILDHYRQVLGRSFTAYHNHVYRIFNLLELLTTDDLTDKAKEKLAIASAFHDIGIWTANTFDYLQPSMDLAGEYLVSIDKESWTEEILATIKWHHKITPYKGPYQDSINLFRKADWIDVTRGMVNFGISRMEIIHLYAEFNDHGFHKFLLKRGWSFAIRNPLRPLPMFKR